MGRFVVAGLSTLSRINVGVDITRLVGEVHALPPRTSIAREAGRLRAEEIDGSLAIAGNPLSSADVRALLERGIATGGHPLDAYLDARDLADAAAWVAEQRATPLDAPRPLLTVDEVRRLHRLVSAGRPIIRPGVWRVAIAPLHHSGAAPPPWQVPREMSALVAAVSERPPAGEVGNWVAGFLARFARIRPFAGVNGRTARLAVSLVLRRLDIPPLVLPRRRARSFLSALAAAESGNRAALADLVEDAIAQSCRRLIAAAGDEPLLPLRLLAGAEYSALIKAAQRGRLQVVQRDRRIFCTAGWISAYRNGRYHQL